MAFMDDGTLFDDKLPLRSLPEGADPRKYPRASDMNALKSAAVGLRTAVLGVQPGFVDPNVAMVTAAGGSAERALQSRFADVVNVKDYGAKGDGDTDDTTTNTTAIEAAIAAAQSTGGTVLFPHGTYDVSVIDNIGTTDYPVRLVGQNATLRTTMNRILVIAANASNLTIEGLYLVSTGTGEDGSDGLVRSYHHQLINLAIRNCSFAAATDGTNAIKLVHDQNGAFLKGLEIAGCAFVGVGRMAIEVTNHVGDTTDRYSQVRITNNRFDGLGKVSTYGQGISLSGPGRGITISGNTFEDARDRAIELIGASEASVIGNTFRNLQASCNPITVAKTAQQTSVSGIAIVGNVADGVTGNWSTQYIAGGVFANNSYVGSGEVLFWHLSDMSISGNRIETANNIWFEDVTGSVISGNSFRSTTATAGHPRLDTVTACQFVGNRFASSLSYGLLVQDGSANNSFVGNTFDNTAAGSPYATLRFDGAGTTGNTYISSTHRKLGGAEMDETNGATGNTTGAEASSVGRVVMSATGSDRAVNAALGEYFEMTPADANAFTFARPTNGFDGQTITFSIRHATACNAGDPFPAANGWRTSTTAWAAPAPDNGKSVTFIYRSGADQWIQMGAAVEYAL